MTGFYISAATRDKDIVYYTRDNLSTDSANQYENRNHLTNVTDCHGILCYDTQRLIIPKTIKNKLYKGEYKQFHLKSGLKINNTIAHSNQ